MKLNTHSLRIGLLSGFLVTGIFFLAACFDNGTTQPELTDPVIEALDLHYSQTNHNLFIAARVVDPQSRDNIDEVHYALYEMDSSGTELATLFIEGTLFDNGGQGDIIIRDDVFSILLDADLFAEQEGYFAVIVQAFDQDGHSSESAQERELVRENNPPVLYLLLGPSTFERGDTLKFKVRAVDPQGYDDIVGVRYSIAYPDGHILSDPTFVMRDDGQFGDDLAHDGIFTVFQPYGKSGKNQGLFVFSIVAKDFSGAHSDTLKISASNPGVTIMTPNTAETYHHGQTLNIRWESAYISQVIIAVSYDADQSDPEYQSITTITAALKQYSWMIPADRSSDYCRIKVYDAQKTMRYDISDQIFRIQP